MKKNDYSLIDKNSLRKIPVEMIVENIPELKEIEDSKTNVISDWLINWIEENYQNGNIKEYDLLPKKTEFAYHLGVSIGTAQNVFRLLEDKGYVQSKQRIGTMIRNWKNPKLKVRKLTSKRDIAVEDIKKYLLKSVKVGEKIPSTRILASMMNISSNTVRLAIENLCLSGILHHENNVGRENYWILQSKGFSVKKEDVVVVTLAEKVQKDLENYIIKNLKVGQKMPAHEFLSKDLKVSIKTIHDAFNVLVDKKILLARRGRYGTVVLKMPNDANSAIKPETTIFAPAYQTAFYNYEKTQEHIKKMIAENYEIGSKLPSIMDFSKQLDLSPNTIRKAFENLAKQGYLRFARGRYGGTFVIDIPEIENGQAFKWLAVNPTYAKIYK